MERRRLWERLEHSHPGYAAFRIVNPKGVRCVTVGLGRDLAPNEGRLLKTCSKNSKVIRSAGSEIPSLLPEPLRPYGMMAKPSRCR